LLEFLKTKCKLEYAEFKHNCGNAQNDARSNRLLLSTPLVCRDVAALHIGDGKEYMALNCELL
jgi:hypothetical protein